MADLHEQAAVNDLPSSHEAAAGTRSLTVEAIHAHVGGELSGDAAVPITGVNSLEAAGPGEITFAECDSSVQGWINHVGASSNLKP